MPFRVAHTAFIALLVLTMLPGNASPEAQLTSYQIVVDAVSKASVVTLSAYTLPKDGELVESLLATAHRPKTRVSVIFDGQPFPDVRRSNERLAEVLTGAGVQVRLSQRPLHMKAIVIDGTRVFVTDRNWTSSDSLILELPATLRIAVEKAILGQSSSTGSFTTRKADALVLEDEVLSRGTGAIMVETESFGPSVIADELENKVRQGVPVTLIVARYEYDRLPSEQRLVEHLRDLGIEVVVANAAEKLAVRGGLGFIGSANATAGLPDQIDWGYATNAPDLIRALSERMLRNANMK